jgi:hypothetical protein
MTHNELTDTFLKEIGRADFPFNTQSDIHGQLVSIEFQKEWKSGSTIPEEFENEDGETEIRYVDDYKNEKLTKDQVSKIEKIIGEVLGHR